MKQKRPRPLPKEEERKRLMWVSLFIFALFSLLIIQFYKVQIVEGDKWSRQASIQHQLVVHEPFKRGVFYSNNGIKKGHPDKPQPFVVDVPKFHLYIDPLSIPEACRSEIASRLAMSLHLSDKDKTKLRGQFDKTCHSRKLVMWMSAELKDMVMQWWNPYAHEKKIARNALFFVQDYRRCYPFGKLLGQVLHTVREDKDPKTQEHIPTGGLEATFNSVLKGKPGKRVLMRSPRHPLETGKIVAYPEHGADVYLTINHHLQAIMEEEIAKAVQRANAKSGWAIMMDPKTGEIFGLAQYPYFDPSKYRDYFNDPRKFETTRVQAVTDPYEPGSTFKAITLAVCLKANVELKKRGKPPLFSPAEKVPTTNTSFPGRNKPLKDTHMRRFCNMNIAMQKSSNIYMARMIQRVINTLGEEWYRKTLHETFGFGKKTGIEIPSESIGLLPTPGKKHPNGALEWSSPTPYSLAMGHNILVNSFQMLRAYGMIANGGYDVQPTMIRKVVKTHRDGRKDVLVDHTQPSRVESFKRLLEPEVVDPLVYAMRFVTKPGGSASKGDIPGYTEAGKTGTTEKIVNGVYSKNTHISTFVGFAPAKDPRFVLLIAIDEPESKYIPGFGKNQMGGNCAAPAFKEIGLRSLQYLGVEPDDPYGYPAGDPRSQPDKAEWAPQLQELKKISDAWNG
jgi:cell division protein FtsI (penicillin-binding protein 3)